MEKPLLFSNHSKFWLECYEKNASKRIIYLDLLNLMKVEDFLQFIQAHPNRYCSNGLYCLWPDQKNIIKRFTTKKIDFKQYDYDIVTEHFINLLKEVKASDNLFKIEWFNKITGKKEGDNQLMGIEEMPKATIEDLCKILEVNIKKYPFDGVAQEVLPKHKEAIQPYLKHQLDFNQYTYFITNAAKGLNCAEWEKWLPI